MGRGSRLRGSGDVRGLVRSWAEHQAIDHDDIHRNATSLAAKTELLANGSKYRCARSIVTNPRRIRLPLQREVKTAGKTCQVLNGLTVS